jgi:NAD(P)H-hydrate epimerase
MRPVLTPAEAAELDRAARARGIAASALMERAGEAVARAAADVAGGVYGRRAAVVCGGGNNGGDGFVAARHLARRGMRVSVVRLAEDAGLREPAAENALRLREVEVRELPASGPAVDRELARADVAVDAIFGTGFRGTPEGRAAEAIDALNGCDAPVVAVDVPSGVNGETGAVDGEAVWAEATVTFGAEKPGTLLYPGAERAGLVEVADIGFPGDLVKGDLAVVEAEDVAGWYPSRPAETNKRAAGVALVVGGSRDMTGAPRLAATAAYRIGAGLVAVAVPRGVEAIVQAALAEAIYVPLAETPDGVAAVDALDELLERAGSADAVAIGPGMGRAAATAELVRRFVRESPVPVVIDADALNAFEGRAADLAERRSDAVLTPHAGEFARIAGEVGTDRIASARWAAAALGWNVTFCRCGVIAGQDGRQ